MLLEVADLTVRAEGGLAIDLPQLTLAEGTCAALFGPSGCGKSTLLAAMFGLLQRRGWTSGGQVICQGQRLDGLPAAQRRELLRRGVVFLPQDALAALDPLAPIGEQLQDATERPLADCAAMLARLGLAEPAGFLLRRPHALSGGQAQRVLLAIAFLRASPLVVVDEPTASLDADTYDELVAQLRALLAEGRAVLMATHEARLAHDLAAVVYTRRGSTFVRALPEGPAWPIRPALADDAAVVLAAHGVKFAFAGREVLGGVDVSCRRGEIVAVVGASGAGKTTLLRVLAGRLPAAAGTVTRPARAMAVQLVGQDAAASLTPGRPLRKLLAEAGEPGFDAAAGAAAVGLPQALLEQPGERMSVGEQRRAALLRALAVLPEVLLLDEPTSSLDGASACGVLATLLALQHVRGLAMVIVTHDLAMAAAIAHRVLRLQGGRLCPA